MKELRASTITETVADLCKKANYYLPADVVAALEKAYEEEPSPAGKDALRQLLENQRIAREEDCPMCQDTGLAVVYLDLGQEVHVVGGDLYAAVEEGVRQGYIKGYLRKSAVRQPFSARVNTKDNTPPIIHTRIVPGDTLKITVLPKGAGSENMSALAMLTPAKGVEGIKEFVIQTVDKAGSNPCPPIIVGVGIGGTADKTMEIAKEAVMRPIGQHNPDPEVAALEIELLDKINKLGIGPQGFGGKVTALAVNVETFPAHIASMPVAVCIQCNAARQAAAEL
ncbi:MAG: fumarate hydratase [Chloroflexi bacterium]|nr:fumarate hydratase [Chloroflexota bacterium]